MRHKHKGGHNRQRGTSEDFPQRQRHHHGSHHRHYDRYGRLFDYGELRLVLLALISEEPRHGYEFIKLIEERSGGSYSPSPGVIYPTLAWLDDMGYAQIALEVGGRKNYNITREGKAFLAANRAGADELLSRLASHQGRRVGEIPYSVIRAMENFRLAMRLRLKRGPLEEAQVSKIAAALDAAAMLLEKN